MYVRTYTGAGNTLARIVCLVSLMSRVNVRNLAVPFQLTFLSQLDSFWCNELYLNINLAQQSQHLTNARQCRYIINNKWKLVDQETKKQKKLHPVAEQKTCASTQQSLLVAKYLKSSFISWSIVGVPSICRAETRALAQVGQVPLGAPTTLQQIFTSAVTNLLSLSFSLSLRVSLNVTNDSTLTFTSVHFTPLRYMRFCKQK